MMINQISVLLLNQIFMKITNLLPKAILILQKEKEIKSVFLSFGVFMFSFSNFPYKT